MRVRILGSAAGGGFPQWNCGCRTCRAVRENGARALRRTQSSIAVRGSGSPWLLVNASPDVREQLELLRDPEDRRLRSNPFAAVLLTDAEIDHSAGLIILRESAEPLRIHGTPAVRRALTDGFPALEVLDRYCGVRWSDLEPGGVLEVPGEEGPSLRVEPFVVSADPPLYMRGRGGAPAGSGADRDLAIGLVVEDLQSGRKALYAPAVAELDDAMLERLGGSDVALIDGTFWSNDELPGQGVGTRTALDMGHLPLSGPEGTLERLRHLGGPRKILVHINNSNPVLLEDSPERRAVEDAGFEVAYDGMVIDL
jgi:pyrroloquinoline quinone biosynthesis protein B